MGERAETWAKNHDWISDFIYPVGGWEEWAAMVAPRQWRTAGTSEDDNEVDACFELGVGPGDTAGGIEGEDYLYLTRLCHVGVGEVGLRFKANGISKPRWRRAFSHLAGLVSDSGLVATSEPSFFLSFAIVPTELAAALREEDPDAALGPFEAALDTLLKAKPSFDKVVQHLRALDK